MDSDVKISGFFGPSVICSSIVLFGALDCVVFYGLIPNSVHKSHHWRYRNILLSFVHSVIAGAWSLLCIYREPRLAEDVISTYSRFSVAFVSFSIGYFLHDCLHMLLYHRKRESYELLGHHVVVIVCFGIAVFKHTYVGYAVVSLLVEVNSVFLHARQLLQVCGYRKTKIYRYNSLVNLGTFICFRIATLAWMTRWIFLHRDEVPLLYYSIGSVGLAIMTAMNIILFYRLIVSDFVKKSSEQTQTVKDS